jgi:hypothetical protein
LQYLLAMAQFGAWPGERYAEVAETALRAAEAPSLVPVRRDALLLAATCEGFLGSPRRPKPDLPMRQRAAAHVRQVVALGPIRPHEYEAVTKILHYVDDVNLARSILDSWEAKASENLEEIRLRYEVEMKGRSFFVALEAAKKGRKLAPKDETWKQRQQAAEAKIREELKAAGQGD